jgi:hypothetical protein
LFLLLLFFGVLKWVLDFNSSVEEEEARPCRRRSGSLTAKDMGRTINCCCCCRPPGGIEGQKAKNEKKKKKKKKK